MIIFLVMFTSACRDEDPGTCFDGIQNGNEEGVDCGGDCTYHCKCFNGEKDEGEICIDCGGDCPECELPDGRYANKVFQKYYMYAPIPFGFGISEPENHEEILYLSFYEPAKDTASARPLIIMMGETSYAGEPDSYYMLAYNYVEEFVLRGYVIANISNIRNWEGFTPMLNSVFLKTAMDIRADYLACIRFFRKHAAEFRIDTDTIWLMGASFGGMAALHAAFIDESDLSWFDDMTADYIESTGIEGQSGNEGYSSNVKGVINLTGMILDVEFIDQGEPYVFSLIGVNDPRPFECEIRDLSWIKDPYEFCGPVAINKRMLETGFRRTETKLKLITASPGDRYAAFDANQCPECAAEIVEFIAIKLGYCQD
jgi:hypothetical protein